MDEYLTEDDMRAVLKNKLRHYFDGKIVRPDESQKILSQWDGIWRFE